MTYHHGTDTNFDADGPGARTIDAWGCCSMPVCASACNATYPTSGRAGSPAELNATRQRALCRQGCEKYEAAFGRLLVDEEVSATNVFDEHYLHTESSQQCTRSPNSHTHPLLLLHTTSRGVRGMFAPRARPSPRTRVCTRTQASTPAR